MKSNTKLCIALVILFIIRVMVQDVSVAWRSRRSTWPLFMARNPSGPRPFHCWGFEITLKNTSLCRTHLDEWSARRRDLYLTTHGTYKRQTSMPLTGFEPVIPASKRPQTHALDYAATGTSQHKSRYFKNSNLSSVDRLDFVTYRRFSVRWMCIKIPALYHTWRRTASLYVVGGLVGYPRMEDLTTFMCTADNGTTAARECGEFQRDEIKPLELAHSCRRYLILAREGDFREFLFV